jgi:hypothetical protein
MDSTNHLFTVLTQIAAPALLTNASSVLALNTANRFGRVVDRSRAVAAGLRGMAPDSIDYGVWQRQLDRLKLRGKLLMRAQTGLYLAIGAFVGTALFAVLGSMVLERAPGAATALGVVGIVLGILATGSLLSACVLIARETRVALAGLQDDVTAFGDPRPAPPLVLDPK